MSTQYWYVAIEHAGDGDTRYFIFVAADEDEAFDTVSTFMDGWADEDYWVMGWGPAVEYIQDMVLELCTFRRY